MALLVSSSMHQNHDPGFTEQHFSSVSYFMADFKPNVQIRDDDNLNLSIELVSDKKGQLSIERLCRE